MINFNTMAELIRMAEEKSLPVHDIVLAREMHTSQRSRDVLWQEMQRNWQVMQESVQRGIANEEHSVSGLTGGDAKRLYAAREQSYTGTAVMAAAAYAVGIAEVNAVMGRIVACPTAGSCGIVPAALFAAAQHNGNTEDEIVGALFTARHDRGMAVTETVDSDTADEVEVLVAVLIEDVSAFAALDGKGHTDVVAIEILVAVLDDFGVGLELFEQYYVLL